MKSAKGDLQRQLFPIFFLAGIFYLNFLSRVILGPLLPAIEKELGIGHGQAGSLLLTISVGYCLALLCSGFVSSRMTHHVTISISSLFLGSALLMMAASFSMAWLRAGLVMVGLGAGLYFPSGMATITSVVTSSNWGKAIAIHELAPNFGLVTAPLLAELMLGWVAWRGILISIGAACIVLGLAFLAFGSGRKMRGESPNLNLLRAIFQQRDFWIMAALFSLAIGASLGVYTMLPLFLVSERGMEMSAANTLVSLSRVSGVFLAFVAGWFTDLLGPRKVLRTVFIALGGMTILLGVAPGRWIILFLFLQPLLVVCFFPAGLAALSRIGPHSVRNVVVSFTVPIAFFVGGGVIPTGIGVMGEVNSFTLGIVLMGCAILLGGLLIRYLGSDGEIDLPARPQDGTGAVIPRSR